MQSDPHPAWPALINPHRFAEARAAIKVDPVGVLAARGSNWSETALHWAAMSDPASWLDLVASGGDPNATDRIGRTPLDWINDRLWMGTMAPHQRLGEPARDRIRAATLMQVPSVWSSGGRHGTGSHSLTPVKLWIEAGLWDLTSLAAADPDMWRGWDGGSHALHYWVAMADRTSASSLLDRILSTGLSVDTPDDNGHSAIWWAVDAWLRTPGKAASAHDAIRLLRAHGADPDMGEFDDSPAALASVRQVSSQLENTIACALGWM